MFLYTHTQNDCIRIRLCLGNRRERVLKFPFCKQQVIEELVLMSKRVIVKNQNLKDRNGSFPAIKQEQLVPYWIRTHKCINTWIQLGMQLWENGGGCWVETFWMRVCEGMGQAGPCSGGAMPCPTHSVSLGLSQPGSGHQSLAHWEGSAPHLPLEPPSRPREAKTREKEERKQNESLNTKKRCRGRCRSVLIWTKFWS